MTHDGKRYAVGSPCDYCVALCSFENGDQLVPVEEEDEIMDRLFPIAEKVVEEEFGEDLSLVRTAQTLTLVGELDLDEDEEEDEEKEGFEQDDEEEVSWSWGGAGARQQQHAAHHYL